MKWKFCTLAGIAPVIFFLVVGCGTVDQQFVSQMDILFKPIAADYQHMLENGHSWEGISEADKKEIIESKLGNVKKLNQLIEEQKNKKGASK